MVGGVNPNQANLDQVRQSPPNIDPRLLQAAIAEIQQQLGGGQNGQPAASSQLAPFQAQNVDWSNAQVQSVHDQARQVSESTEPFWTPGSFSMLLRTANDLPGLLQHGFLGIKIPFGDKLVEKGAALLGKTAASTLGKAIPGVCAVLDTGEAMRIQKDPNAGFWKKAMGWTTAALGVVGAGLVLTGVGAPLGGALIGASFATGLVRDAIGPSNPAKVGLKGFQAVTSGSQLRFARP
jgi:hypothetical protein